jgi:hypothetical protein
VIVIAANAKYAGLKGDMVLLHPERRSGLEEGLAGFRADRLRIRRLTAGKATFKKIRTFPFSKLIVTRACATHRRKYLKQKVGIA